MSAGPKPSSVVGGCLCESVRYTIKFDPEFDFSKGCTTCQCEQCRKNSGALIAHLVLVPSDFVSFEGKKTPNTLQRYYATPGKARGFCSACGSFLFWHDEESSGINIAAGTLDKAELKKYGQLIAQANRHLWCQDEIPGETDGLKGERWRYDNEGEAAELL